MTRLSLLFAALLIAVLPNLATAQSYTITVAAGDHSRTNTPVLVDSPFKSRTRVSLEDAQGQDVDYQWVSNSLLEPDTGQRLLFVVKSLPAGETATYRVQPSDASLPIENLFAASTLPQQHEQLNFGPRPVVRFMTTPRDNSSPAQLEATYKVFHHVFDPTDGTKIITKGPGGQFTHHRGLFFGFNKVAYNGGATKCDIWHCKGAFQSFDGIVSEAEAQFNGGLAGRQTLFVGWHGPDDKIFAEETRELTAYALPGGTLLDFSSRVNTKVGPIQLDGDPQHAGFHFRASNEVSEKSKSQTYYLRPDGKGKPGETRNWDAKGRNPQSANLPWNAMSFVLGEQRYTVVYVDHPLNPKEARYSERDYGRFGSYFEYEITDAKPLVVRYRVWVQRGELTVEQAAALASDFVTPPKAIVSAK